MRFSQKALAENHARLVERNALFHRYGYDEAKNAAFILSKALPLTGRILEIGTGKGRFLTALLRQTSGVTTIDINREEQQFARLNVAFAKPPGKARFVIADAAHLPWRSGTFDAVVSMNALHHITDLPAVVDEAIRVVKPAGKIVLADFNKRGFAIMERVHRSEGRTHEHTRYRFRDVVNRFVTRGWNVVLRSRDCEDVLIATKKTMKK